VKSFTPLQGEYLCFIYIYDRLHGRPPAEADIQRFFRVTPPAVHHMIVTLTKNGLICRIPGAPRSIQLLVPATDLPLREFLLTNRETHSPSSF
jgi:DNA-binding MarR family transcriptional regulator